MNFWDVLILLAVGGLAALGLCGARKRERKGCGGSCAGCSRRGCCGL